ATSFASPLASALSSVCFSSAGSFRNEASSNRCPVLARYACHSCVARRSLSPVLFMRLMKLLHAFPVRADVETGGLGLLAHAQAERHRNQHQQDQADDERVRGAGA